MVWCGLTVVWCVLIEAADSCVYGVVWLDCGLVWLDCGLVCVLIEAADSCALNAACFLTHSEVAAVNSIGQFKIWDVRRPSIEPVRAFVP